MKKIVLILTALLTLVSCGKQEQEIDKTVTITNSVELNTYDADMRGYKWLYDSEPAFTEITLDGYVGCPWCERAVPILNKVAKETGVTVYYINVHFQTTMEAYNELMTYISPILEKDSEGEPVFKVPEVIAVKDGEITDHHLALVEDFKIENDDSQMSDSQKKELEDIYLNLIQSAKD